MLSTAENQVWERLKNKLGLTGSSISNMLEAEMKIKSSQKMSMLGCGIPNSNAMTIDDLIKTGEAQIRNQAKGATRPK
jgi:hypothetical protein